MATLSPHRKTSSVNEPLHVSKIGSKRSFDLCLTSHGLNGILYLNFKRERKILFVKGLLSFTLIICYSMA